MRLTDGAATQALRAHVRAHGMGDLLYLTKYFQRELDLMHERVSYVESRLHEIVDLLARDEERGVRRDDLAARQGQLLAHQSELLGRLEERLADLERAVSDASLVSLLRRRYRRLKAALTR